MYEHDNRNTDIEMTFSESKEKTIDDNNTDNTSNRTHGTIYTPSEDGNGYSCERYSSTDLKPENTVSEPTSHDSSTKSANKKRGSTTARYIAFTIALCFVFSICAASASAFLTRAYLNSHYQNSESTTDEIVQTDTDRVMIDTSERPNYMTEIAEPGTLMTMEQAIASVKDSVVEITTETVKSGYGGFSQYVVSGAGSGVIISEGGYIITNNHVIEGASNIKVRLTDGSEYEAVLVGTDPKTDVAVISISPKEGFSLKNAIMGNSSSLSLGQTVIAIGNPLGELGGTVTDGIISSLAREVAIDGSGTMTLLQTNAAVSPGNSGGGLFDLYGRLIGVVNAKSTGEGIEGISFAIPIDTAWDVANQLIDKGYVSGRPSLGAILKELHYGHTIFGETYTFVVVEDTNGVEGFKNEDVIVGIDNYEVSTLTDISEIIANRKIGDKITVRVIRDKRNYDIEVTVIEYVPIDNAKLG